MRWAERWKQLLASRLKQLDGIQMMSSLLEVLKTKTFLEKVLLLLLGATITGIFVPIVKSSMDKRQFEQQKRFEATVARQAEILKTQSNFLREFAEYVWEFQLSALQVSYYRGSSEKLFKEAVSKYDEQSWLNLMKIRAAVGGARWYTSDTTYALLNAFIDDWLIYEVDLKLMNLIRKGENAKWTEFHSRLFNESKIKTNAILLALAEDYGLAPMSVEKIEYKK